MMHYWLPDWLYDLIKLIVTVLMPAASVLYVTLAGIWGWPSSPIRRDLSSGAIWTWR